MRLPPGETTLAKATKITLHRCCRRRSRAGDGKVADDHKSVPARRLVVMTKSDIAKKQTRSAPNGGAAEFSA